MKGNDLFVAARVNFAAATTLKGQARAALSDTSPESNGNAISLSTRADGPATDIRVNLDAAVREFPLLKEPAAKLQTELTALLADTASIRQTAMAKNHKIDEDRKEAERDRWRRREPHSTGRFDR